MVTNAHREQRESESESKVAQHMRKKNPKSKKIALDPCAFPEALALSKPFKSP